MYCICNFQVYVEPLTHNDLLFITKSMYPKIDGIVLEKMITFNSQVNIISPSHTFLELSFYNVVMMFEHKYCQK